MAYYVYILQSEKNGSFYIGHPADLRKRIQRHNQGRSLFTKSRIRWKLIYQEEFNSRGEASKREYKIKQKKNRAYIEYLVRASRD
jgi:putative endonuclease